MIFLTALNGIHLTKLHYSHERSFRIFPKMTGEMSTLLPDFAKLSINTGERGEFKNQQFTLAMWLLICYEWQLSYSWAFIQWIWWGFSIHSRKNCTVIHKHSCRNIRTTTFRNTKKCLLLSQHLLVQSQQWKRHNNMWNLFKVNNKDIRTTSLTSFWRLYSDLWTDFTYCSGVSFIDFEQVKVGYSCLLEVFYFFASCLKIQSSKYCILQ